MRHIPSSAYEIASQYLGVAEVPGSESNPSVLAMLRLDADWPKDDETSWCSAFANWIAHQLGLPRSKSLLARSWLAVGFPVELAKAERGLDVVILSRGDGEQPGADNTTAPGHVGFYAGRDGDRVMVLGGNQSDRVTIAAFPLARVLAVRRLADGMPDGGV